jgi:glycogen synthase
LLNVGRLGPEKNPTLLPEILAGLRQTDSRWSLAVAGVGPMAESVRRRAEELGVASALDLLGYVPNGPPLLDEYRRSHAFLHVSLTEGLPQVIFEAHAAGLPIVATDVGGVADALEGGETGLLVPPAEAQPAVEALERLRDDEPLRRRLIARGLQRAKRDTMDVQLDRIAEFLRSHVAAPR